MLHSHAVTRHADENGIIVNNESCMENAEMCVGARRTTWFYTSVWAIRGHVKHFVTRNKAPIDDYFPIRPSKDVYDDSIRGRHAWLRIIVSSLSLIKGSHQKGCEGVPFKCGKNWSEDTDECSLQAHLPCVTLALSRSTKHSVSAGALNR